MASSAGDVIGSIKNTVNAIKDVLDSLGEAIDAWKQSKKAETMMTIAKAVAVMAASLTVLSMIKPERLAGGIGALTATIGELVGAFLLLDKFGGNTKSAKLGAMSVTMVAMASSVLILAGAAAKLASIDSGKLVSSIVALGAIMGGLTAVSVVLSKTGGKFMKGATGMIAFATAVRIMASAVNAMSGLSWEELVRGLVGIGVLCVELGAFLAVSKFDKLGVLKGTGLILLATALNILQSAVAKFGSMNLNEIQNGLIAVGAALAEFAAFGIVTGFSKKMLASSTSVLILSGSMVVLSRAMKSISGLSGEEIKKSLIAIGGALAEFVLALNLTKGTLGSAASLTVMTVAINLLVPALTGLGNLSLAQIGMGLLAIAGAFGVVGVAATLLAPVAPVVIGLSLAISALAVSIGAMLALVTAADFFGRLGESLSALNGLSFQVFLANIKAMAWLLVEFVAGIFKGLATIAGTIATSIASIITAVCDGIAQAAPSIGNALAQLIVTVCNVIVQCSEPIGQALFTLGTVAIQTIIDLIAWAWDGGGGEGGGIKGALSSLWANITSFIGEKFNPANWFKEGSLLDGLFGAANKAADERDATEYGKSVGDKLAEGMNNSQKDIRESSANLAKTVEDATRETAGINSPSTMMEENGYWLDMGLAQGMEGTAGMAAITAACGNISSTINSQFRDYWGIHSPSTVSQGDASNILAGMCIGFSQTDGLQNSLLTLNGGIRSTLLGGMDTTKTDVMNKATDIIGALSGVFGGETTTAEDILKTLGGSGSPTTNPTTTGGTSTTKKTGKTLAEQIQARYKTRLEANKTAQSIIDREYALWQAENQYSASEDELMAKKAAHAADAITAQTERVSIAQAKYDALYSKWGAEKAETKTAYNELLQEKTSLAELKAQQYTDLFEEVAKRYDTNLDTLEKQYNLWSADNDRTATKRDKILKEREYQTEGLAIREKKEANAKEQYEKLSELYGESDLRTIAAYNEWLDAQTESLELRNGIAEKQYELIEADIETIKDAQNLAVSQMELLQKVYNDGDLSARADAYREAVETYGKDSEQARKARYQGTVSGILAAVSAVKSMNAQMEQTLQYEQLLEQAKKDKDQERIQSYNEQLLDSQTAFLGFAENLADALNLGDTGKQVTLKLAKAIQKNWKPIKEGFNTAMDKAFANNPELKKKLTDAFGTAFSETGIEVGTEFVSTIVAMMQGDWANALASGLNFMIDFLQTDMGEDLMNKVLPKITELFSNVGKAAQGAQLGQAMGEMGGEMATVATEGNGLLAVLQAVAGGIGEIGTAVASFVAEFWPYILAVVAIIGVLAGIAALFNKHNGVDDVDKELAEKEKDSGSDLDINFAWGINAKKDKVDDAVTAMTQNAVDIAASAAQSMEDALNEDWDYNPTIRPVVDLTEVWDSAEDVNGVFAGEKPMELDSSLSARLAKDADRTYGNQNGTGADTQTGRDTELLNAVSRLGDHMDAVGESIRGMKVVMDGRKTVGYIDSQLGVRAERRR